MKSTRNAKNIKFSLCIGLCVIFSLVLSNLLLVQAAPLKAHEGPIAGTRTLPPEALNAPVLLLDEAKITHSSRLDSSLSILAEQPGAARLADSLGLRSLGEFVQVQVLAAPGGYAAVQKAMQMAGGQVTGASWDQAILQGWLPVESLKTFATNPQVEYVRAPEQVSLFDVEAGSYNTEGLAVMNGPAWHSAGFQGSGIKVAIFDAGFQGYTSLLGSDLPASLTVKNFVDGETDGQVDGTTSHGTACAEIVYDIAPQATIYLGKINTNIDLQEAIDWAKSNSVDVVSTSLGWYNLSPGDGTGFFANMVQDARSNGILWVTAAGTDRERHWGGAFNDPDADNYHEFSGSTQDVDFFGPGDGTAYNINPGFAIQVFLRWDDWSTVNQDYDLYLLRWNGSAWEQVAKSENVQSGQSGQTPTEYVYYATSGTAAPYGFMIVRYSSSRNVNLEVFAPQIARLDKIVTARSLANLADSPDAITVAAIDVTSPYPQEPYSPEGPTNGPGGTAAGGFTKPDLSAFANVSTASYGTSSKFNGTSAATPHVAGAAVLVQDANPSYTPAQIESFLTGRAVDMGASGMDNIFGYGRLYLGAPPSTNTAPTISGLPDQSLSINTSKNNAIDLWAYASDQETADSGLTFTINNSPNPSAGVSLDSNRYIDIAPASGWTGNTDVIIKVADPGGLNSTDTFKVTVSQTQVRYLFMPLSQQRYVTPIPPLAAGLWSGQGVEFYVTPDRQNVRNFTLKFTLQNCPGTHTVVQSSDAAISGDKFSFGGSFYASGTFTSTTSASGSGGLTDYYLSECGFEITTSFNWAASWQNSSQPTSLP